MSMSVGASSTPLSYLQTLMQNSTAAGQAAASDPMAALFQSAAGLADSGDATTQPGSGTGTCGGSMSASTLSTLLSTQDQSTSGTSTQSILSSQSDGTDKKQQSSSQSVLAMGAGDRNLPSGAGGTAASAAGSADVATVQTVTNSDGSVTTTTAYADGSTAESTTAALPDDGVATAANSASQTNANMAAQWNQLQSQLLSAAVATLSVIA